MCPPNRTSRSAGKNSCPFSTLEKQQALKAIEYSLPMSYLNENDRKHLKGIAKKLRLIIESELEPEKNNEEIGVSSDDQQ
ncbi:hypothetical protein [Pseudoalteromonas peptidolytica]|uniref:hypothetical protein n=1 Tax=Pseudoalteromonas peptidolytica TaxID=61150 RepID=UPI00298DB48B|nr:hypothetical protein [Pseudoalteromonas peptidolytica]MDW7548180.1 hypothetical protein [Pseudoalteromonas peptidolytica]